MMFTLLFDLRDRFLNTWISSVLTAETSSLQYFKSPNRSARAGKNQTVPYGTIPWGGDVPGYDRTSLRDESNSRCEGFALS